MRALLFALFFVSVLGCSSSTTPEGPSPDAAVEADATAGATAADAARDDADVVCLTISRPTGSCDLSRGSCCTDSHCERNFCRYDGWVCAGELEHCVHRDDCCNGRHSCIDNACQY
jgi:hypothetical protein